MKSNFQKVLEFHRAFGAAIGSEPKMTNPQRTALRLRLNMEEHKEMLAEFAVEPSTRPEELNTVEPVGSIEDIVKELADILVVTYGFFAELGVDADKAFEEVHSSNMSKLGADGKPVHRADGKILKGPNYRIADPGKLLNSIEG